MNIKGTLSLGEAGRQHLNLRKSMGITQDKLAEDLQLDVLNLIAGFERK